eukprot:TRINITY_DN8758_c0_g1_i1.p1 TRINITY_DN8758_c0_g1~~TRINITY_DN8758_c0_g1_i1.p1  ORF type:complete len:517 (-),score=221.18 TRINITY_DN8758_c0_g1_i1:37-1587(-)
MDLENQQESETLININFFRHISKITDKIDFKSSLFTSLKANSSSNYELNELFDLLNSSRQNILNIFLEQQKNNSQAFNQLDLTSTENDVFYQTQINKYLSLLRGFFVDTTSNYDFLSTIASSSSSSSILNPIIQNKDNGNNTNNNEANQPSSTTTSSNNQIQSSSALSNSANLTLRFAIATSWTNTLSPYVKTELGDLLFELLSFLIQAALFIILYVDATLSQLKNNEEKIHLLSYDYMLKAAGIFQFLEEKLLTIQPKFSTLIIPVEISQPFFAMMQLLCLAQAQEITIARAVIKGNTNQLISKLSKDTADKFSAALNLTRAIEELNQQLKKQQEEIQKKSDPNQFLLTKVDFISQLPNLINYFRFKIELYLSKAWIHHAIDLSTTNTCGQAVAAARMSQNHLLNAIKEADNFNSQKETKHCKETLNYHNQFNQKYIQKFERENKLVYFDRVPATAIGLAIGKGLVQPKQFQLPPTHPIWTSAILSNFQPYPLENSIQNYDLPKPIFESENCSIL